MPHVIVKIWPGKSEAQERALSDAIVRGVTDTLGSGEDAVSVAYEEVPAGEWSTCVYGPDIQDRWSKLIKQPGYGPGGAGRACNKGELNMDHTHLGRTGLRVSRLMLGTMNFGELTDEQTSFAIMDEALDAGINLFDTADVYGGPQKPDMEKGYGVSEEIIGRWLAQGGGRRDRIALATKVYQPMETGPNDKYLSAYHIRRACEASLRRLQTDHIDLYQMHHVDRATPWEEIWQAMEQLIREGKVTYVGSSNFAGWDIATAQMTAAHRNGLGLASEQSLYNLTQRAAELEVIPACRHFGIGLIPWSPIGMGLLGGVLKKAEGGRRGSPVLQQQIEAKRSQLEAYEKLCDQIGEAPADVALSWLLHNPVVTAAISGPRTVEQLRQNLKAPTVKLTSETLAMLDEIWPGPGGEAPVAYAW